MEGKEFSCRGGGRKKSPRLESTERELCGQVMGGVWAAGPAQSRSDLSRSRTQFFDKLNRFPQPLPFFLIR